MSEQEKTQAPIGPSDRDRQIDRLAGLIANLQRLGENIRHCRDVSTKVPEPFDPSKPGYQHHAQSTPSEAEIDESADISASLVYDIAIHGRVVIKELEDLTKIIKARTDKALAIASDLMVDEGTNQIARHGQLLYLSEERFIKMKISDLLPPGVDPRDPKYKDTVERCKAHAKERFIQALKDSELSDLVSEGYNAISLKSRLVGSNAEFDENDEPIIPEAIDDLIDIESFYRVKTRKSSKKSPKKKS